MNDIRLKSNEIQWIVALQDQVNEWANMTGFLCALGGVCLQRRSPRPLAAGAATSSTGVLERKSNVSVCLWNEKETACRQV